MIIGSHLSESPHAVAHVDRGAAKRVSRRTTRQRLQVMTAAVPLLFLLGSAFNLYAFGSFQPVLAALMFFLPVWGVVAILMRRTPVIPIGFAWLLAFYWFCAGLAAAWDAENSLSFISFVDAYHFYNFVLNGNIPTDLEILRRKSEGALAIFIWDWCYWLAHEFGAGNGAYVGVVVNILMMAGTGVVAARMLTAISGSDPEKCMKLFLAFSLNGLFLIFAVTHIRDAFVCFSVAFFTYFWVRYLVVRTLGSLVIVIATSVVCAVTMLYLRFEFQFLPIGLLGAAVAALMIGDGGTKSQRVWFRILGAVAGLSLLTLLLAFGEDLRSSLVGGGEGYSAGAVRKAADDSLGLALIVNQPLPIRLIAGPAYSLLMPLPVWIGLEMGTIYHMGKSLGALFSYFFVPAVLTRILCMIKASGQRPASVIFLMTVFTVFLLAISVTSLENRHVAAFMPLAIVAVFSRPSGDSLYNKIYSSIQLWFLTAIVILHVAWAALKFL